MRQVLTSIFTFLTIVPTAFADSCAVIEKPLSLESAMKLAHEHSYDNKIAASKAREASEKANEVLGALGPRVSLEGKKIWIDKDVNKLAGNVAPNATFVPDEITTLGVQLTQPLTDLLPAYNGYTAAKAVLQAADTIKSAGEEDSQLIGAKAYLMASKMYELASVAKSSVMLFEQQMKDMNVQVNTGRNSELDASRIHLALNEAQITLSQAQTQFENSIVNLKEVIGLSECDGEIIFEKSERDFSVEKSQSGERLEVIAARYRLDATQAVVEHARTSLWVPSVSFVAKYDRDLEQKTIDMNSLVTGLPTHYDKKDIWDNFSYGFVAHWTIWDNGTKWAQINQALEQREQAELAYRQASALSRVEKKTVENNLNNMKSVLESAIQTRKFAEDVYRLTNIRFQNGASTTSDLILAERDLTRARASEVNAHADVVLAGLQYQRALGIPVSGKN